MRRRRGGLFRRIFRALNPFRARVTVSQPPPPPEPPDHGGGGPFFAPEPPPESGWHLTGYYSPAVISKDNWQDIERGATWPTDREFHRSPVLTFRLGNTDKYRSFLGPTDATIDDIIAYLTEEYGEDAA